MSTEDCQIAKSESSRKLNADKTYLQANTVNAKFIMIFHSKWPSTPKYYSTSTMSSNSQPQNAVPMLAQYNRPVPCTKTYIVILSSVSLPHANVLEPIRSAILLHQPRLSVCEPSCHAAFAFRAVGTVEVGDMLIADVSEPGITSAQCLVWVKEGTYQWILLASSNSPNAIL
jgi:hypothetical protein